MTSTYRMVIVLQPELGIAVTKLTASLYSNDHIEFEFLLFYEIGKFINIFASKFENSFERFPIIYLHFCIKAAGWINLPKLHAVFLQRNVNVMKKM